MVPSVRSSGRLLRCIGWMSLIAVSSSLLIAAPPRELDAEDEAEPAAFTIETDTPRPLSPRTRFTGAAAKPSSSSKHATTYSSLWGTVIGLGVVFSLFVAGKVWLTRHGPASLRGLPAEALELLGKRMIEPRVSIHLVRCGPKILVLGVAPDGVRTLTEITDPVEIDLMAGACRKKDADQSNGQSFAGLFRQSAARTGGG